MATFFEAYNRANMVQQCLPDMPISDQCSGHWQLDERMRGVFDPLIQQYNQGLIHSMELVQALIRECDLPRS